LDPLLTVDALETQIRVPEGALHAVDRVSFAVPAGGTVGIVGESGSGKSMTALSIIGLVPRPHAEIIGGTIQFDGRDLAKLPERELERVRGREIGMIFQDPMTSLHPTLTIGTQITEVLRRHMKMGRRDARDRAAELLVSVGIRDGARRLDAHPHEFSGGMRQRVMIAMAIACGPKLLIADEPTTALDVRIQADVLDLLQDLQERMGMAMLLITHDMGVIAQVAEEVVVMYAGQVVERASAEELFARPEHPYTEALLGAIPQPDSPDVRHARLTAIPGRPPTVIDPQPGCRFFPRCGYAGLGDNCGVTTPELRELRPGHWVRSAHPLSERVAAPETVS
jgi:oligopeptide/dipeptide ABC transporter ATP-binding protein